MLSPTSQQLVIQKVEQCFDYANERFNQHFDLPKISFKQRGKVAGSARLQSNELRFNPILLQDNLDIFINEVVPHEVCHLLAHQLYGRVKPHGQEWQALMIDLYAVTPKTHHNMDIQKVAGEVFRYYCQCGTLELSIRRHNKITRGKQNYICRKCHSVLKIAS